MSLSERDWPNFRYIGGRLSLDFVNTIWNYRDPVQRDDHLRDYRDLVDWSRQAGALDDAQADVLLAAADAAPVAAERVLARARELRRAIRELTLARGGEAVNPAALATFNDFVGEYFAPMRLAPVQNSYALERSGDPAALDAVLWPIVRSVVDVLTSGDVARVKECADEACGWLFVDASRAGRRRWCAMDDCGNVAKARRHRARAKAA